MKKFRKSVVLLFCALGVGSFSRTTLAQSSLVLECLRDFQAQLGDSQAQGGGVSIAKQSRLTIGSREDEAVILLHGFMASPWEVASVADELASRGYTVFAPLLRGFGEGAREANASMRRAGVGAWREDLAAQITALTQCYPKVSLVGFSLGAMVLTDWMLAEPEAAQTKVASVALLSPFYKFEHAFLLLVSEVWKLFEREIPLRTLYSLSKVPDLAIPMANPEHYLTEMPLQMISRIAPYVKELRRRSAGVRFAAPSFLVYTESDQTVDWRYARKFQAEHFAAGESVGFSREQKVPHQLTVSDGTYDAGPVARAVADFVDRSAR